MQAVTSQDAGVIAAYLAWHRMYFSESGIEIHLKKEGLL